MKPPFARHQGVNISDFTNDLNVYGKKPLSDMAVDSFVFVNDARRTTGKGDEHGKVKSSQSRCLTILRVPGLEKLEDRL